MKIWNVKAGSDGDMLIVDLRPVRYEFSIVLDIIFFRCFTTPRLCLSKAQLPLTSAREPYPIGCINGECNILVLGVLG